MKVHLMRRIYHHSQETGLTCKDVFKVYDWDVVPVIGATVDDSAWHRNDFTKIEAINITSQEGDLYYVELTSLKVDAVDHVMKYVDIAKNHGWDF